MIPLMPTSGDRIALHVPTLAGGGAERVVVNLANEYARRGIKTDLVLYREEGPYLSDINDNVCIVNLEVDKAPVYAALGAVRPLRRYLSQTEPDVLLSSLTRANIVSILASSTIQTDTRVVVSEHNNLKSTVDATKKLRLKILPILIRTIYPFADDVIAVSHGVANSISQASGFDLQSISTIYNPIVTDELIKQAEEPCSHRWLTEKNTQTPPVVLGAGSFNPQKDFPTLIRAFDRIHEQRDARLIIISDGELRDEYERLISEYNLQNVVDLPGFVENPYSYMRAADVFALSSKWEGFGNVIVEAMACGTPVVSTDCPSGPSEILDGGTYGSLVPVGDDQALATEIINTLNDPISEEILCTRAADFSVEKVAEQYLNVLLPDQY
jgi:glycosyltransferase involved in cell wall biosynthesis